MPIDPDIAIGAELPEIKFSWTHSDVLLYHLALGATELRYVYERGLRVLPTFGVVAPRFHETAPPAVSFPGVDIDLARVLHGTQEITVHAPIPAEGEAVLRTRIADVWDKGKAAVIVQESTAVTPDGTSLYTTRSSIFARGEGGFGGERAGTSTLPEGPREPPNPPSPRAKMLDRVVYRAVPSGVTAVDSCTITAAFSLSHTSAIRVRSTASPSAGIGACVVISCVPCSTRARSMSTPGNDTAGGAVSWNRGATTPNVGSTRKPSSYT